MGQSLSDHNKLQRQSSSESVCPFAKRKTSPSSNGCPGAATTDSMEQSINHKQSPGQPFPLSTDREVSSIPKTCANDPKETNWMYPSEQQFWNAMVQKGLHWDSGQVSAEDVSHILRIHNANNERAWQEILNWESFAGHNPSSVKLLSFYGNSRKLSPRARFWKLVGYEEPFDRHDWYVESNGAVARYVLEYYDVGRDEDYKRGSFISCDLRPALDSFWAARIRAKAFIFRTVLISAPGFISNIYQKSQSPNNKTS